ncbi:MAG TPA: undecaprenyl-diphosphate phosphatase [Streptosporangiaceae bacterium]|nr:undecaprenyl-diphosphate phosphatase [Streptosporangiaceae bacterium]
MTHLTYLEAAVVGLIQGVSEMFPVSSLGHSVLLPAVIGGQWARDLNVAATASPYLAFVVGLHVATALALLIYFWRDWVRIVGGFLSSIRDRRVATADQRLAWMIILATIPVGIVGKLFENEFQVIFGTSVYAGIFLAVNGLILLAGERFRRPASVSADALAARDRAGAELVAAGRHASGGQALQQRERAVAVTADQRLSAMGYRQAVLIGSAQILALLAGISRDGVTMVAGMARGLSREDAARFAFLLATPVIFAAGALKLPTLAGPLGHGIHGQILVGSVASGVGAYLSVRFLLRYLRTRTLTPFGIYCLVAGLGCVIYLGLIK